MLRFSPSRSRRLATALLAAVALALLTAVADDRARAEDPAPVAISAAPDLTWGFKQSWRNYALLPTVNGGAEVLGTLESGYNLGWEFESGSYDPVTATTHLAYQGSVHWQKYPASQMGWPEPPGYDGPPDPFLLDVTLADPQITIGADSALLTAVASSRDKATWQMMDLGRVPLVELDVFGVTPTVAGGTTTWPGIVGTMAAAGVDAFDGVYKAGQVVDAVGFSYSGPGGAPDLSEHWDTPGAAILEQAQNTLYIQGAELVEPQTTLVPIVDREHLIVHTARETTVAGTPSAYLEAFDLATMQPAGQATPLPNQQFPATTGVVAYDTNQQRILYRGTGETGMPRWLRYDTATGTYAAGVFADPQLKETSFIGSSVQRLAWDQARNRGYRVERFVPAGIAANDYDNHVWRLAVYKEGGDGIWQRENIPLPNFPPGQNQNGYAQTFTQTSPIYATASDGSLIVLGTARTSTNPDNPAPATVPAAYRLLIDDATGNVTRQPLFEVENNAGAMFKMVQTAPNGHVLLVPQFGGSVVHAQIQPDGTVAVDPPVSIEPVEAAVNDIWRFAIDPADGTVWFGGEGSQKLAAIRGGELLGGQLFNERNPRGGPVVAGPDHVVYAQTNDGSPGLTAGSYTWGFGRYQRLGFVPEVETQPAPAGVSLTLGEESEPVVFASTASGDPAPARRWQVKPLGSSRFTDLPGQSGPTLTVAAGADDDGSEYRAVYENAAGAVASEPALLSVEFAPRLLADSADARVSAGADAEFSVLADGKPEPQLTWQRRVGGFWQSIDPDDDNFVLGGSTLTVRATNLEQSGALFRARLRNPLGTVYSAAAKLTVEAPAGIPAGLSAASLEWTGSAELQKAPPFGGSNYFSAGQSDGDQASYRQAAGAAAVLQVSAAGAESPASWETRAAHVTNGGKQLVRLGGGDSAVGPDGAATIAWEGAFSVNFYGGLVPFTIADPVLEIGPEGDGTLSADLSGYASSMENPSQREPLAPVAEVTIATFHGAEIGAEGITIVPDYAGVEAEVPAGTTPQNRTATGWGAWPQPFVDFHVATGLAPYWYSSGGAADPLKLPQPILVRFAGAAAPDGGELPRPPAPPAGRAAIVPFKRLQRLKPGQAARLATLACPSGVAPCQVLAPRRVRLAIGGRSYSARVLAPRQIVPGGTALARALLSRPARRALAGRTATLKVRLRLRAGEETRAWLAVVRLRGVPGANFRPHRTGSRSTP